MRNRLEALGPWAALAAGMCFAWALLALPATRIAGAAGCIAAGTAFAGLLVALSRAGDREQAAGIPASGAAVADPLPPLLSAFQAYVDLELWDLALERAVDIVRRFPDRPETDPIRKTMVEIQWKLETRPAPGAAARAATPGRSLPDMYAAVKTYIELEAWPLALDKAQEIIAHHPDSEEAQKLSRNIEVLKGKSAAQRRRAPSARS